MRAFGEVLHALLADMMPGAVLTARGQAVRDSLSSTRAMRIGSAVEGLVMPSDDPEPDGLTYDERRVAEVKASQILDHPEAGRFLRAEGAVYQVAHRWLDEASGVWCRARWDMCYWLADSSPAVQDLKVWSGVTEKNLRYKIRDRHADIQAALYRRAALDLWNVAPPHTLIVADPAVLGPIFVVTLSEATIAAADERVTTTLARLAECYRTGQFIDPAEAPMEI
jgi:hypothetical protein